MTTEPIDELAGERPFWQVQSVYDEEGAGGDFAYTIGLHHRGFPELHLWARPCLGEDPGHDWKLGSRDQCRVLNELAALLLKHEIGVGSTITRRYDGGLATVTYRVDPAEDSRELEAFGVPPGIDVLPVRWALERPPEGAARPLTLEEQAIATTTYDEIARRLDRSVPAPRGWALPERPSFEIDQRYGPLTSVVRARAGQLWQADDDTVCDLVHVAVRVTESFGLSWATSRAIALARLAGRRTDLERLQTDVCALVDALTTKPAAQRHWRSIVRRCDPELWESSPCRQRTVIAENLATALHVLVSACLMVEAVSDVAELDLILCGRGPWVSGLRWQRIPPGPEWVAAPEILGVVRRLLANLSPNKLRWLAETHGALRDGDPPGSDRYQAVSVHLEAWATVSAAGFPLDGVAAAWRTSFAGAVARSAAATASLQDWATKVACALTHRAQLRTGDVEAFVAPYRTRLPDLERTLNEPL